jgi:hypothetical protein
VKENEYAGMLIQGLSRVGFTIFLNPIGFDSRACTTYGLQPGSGDIIGWFPVDAILPGVLGVAAFVSIEAKMRRGRSSGSQIIWRERVDAAGGFACRIRAPNGSPSQEEVNVQAQEIMDACLTRYGLATSTQHSNTLLVAGESSRFTK